MSNEIWKDIDGYLNIYQVSNFGNVRSLDRGVKRKGRMLKACTNTYGYKYVKLSINGETRNHTIHRLVCNAFIKNELNKLTINHKNGIKSDNNVDNLEWATSSENLQHAYLFGLR